MKRKMLLFMIAIAASPFCQAGVSDSIPGFTIQQLDSRNGLSNSCVDYIFQDSDDLLWIATWDGLNVYNGSGFHVFNYSKGPGGNIGSGVVKKIMEDGLKRIWVTTNQGFSRYDKRSGQFVNYFQGSTNANKRAETPMMAIDGQEVYVFDKNRDQDLLVYHYNGTHDRFDSVGMLAGKPAVKVLFDDQHRLWVYQQTGTIVYSDFQQGRPGSYRSFFSAHDVSNIFYTHKQLFYSTRENHLYEIDLSSQEQRLVARLPQPPRDILKYDNFYLIPSAIKGYMAYDATFRPSRLSLQASTEQELQSMQIKSAFAGTEKIVWLGTDGNGVVRVAPFNRYFEKVSPAGQLFNTAVRAFCEVDNELWVGTKGNGIVVMPYTPEGMLKQQRVRSFNIESIGNSAVYTIVKGIAHNAVYVGTDGLGIDIYDRELKKFVRWTDIAGFEKCGLIEFVYAIYEDKDGSLWLGSNGHGLTHISLLRTAAGKWAVKPLAHYKYDGTPHGPFGDAVFAIVPGQHDQLWLACRDGGGLNLLDKKTGSFRNFKAFNYDGGISHNDIISLYRDQRGILWIGTSYGLNWIQENELNAGQPVFGKLTVEEGLPSNTIHAITADGNGEIWVSTNNGLARINVESMSVVRFKEADGLQSNEFSDGSVYRNDRGQVFFGGVYGFNYFVPEKIHYSTGKPRLLLTGLKLGTRPAEVNSLRVLNAAGHQQEEFSLSPSENFLSLSVKAVSYIKADKCIYAYRLEGYDKDWVTLGSGGKIEYGNLPPGDYTLQLKWSDGESGWLPQTEAFRVHVQQYFWLTWPAFALYALLIGTAVYVAAAYRRNRMEMRHKLAMEHLLRTKEDEAHQEKLNFFTNVAHELQTPLTLIAAASQQAMKDEKPAEKKAGIGYYLSLVHSQSARLTYLLQQLMEFRRSDSGHLNNHYTALDLSSFLGHLFELFHPIGERKRLTMTTAIAEGVQVCTDKDKLEKIVFNLLSNVFKHTPDGEDVQLSLRLIHEGKDFLLEVANSGCTLTEADMQQLFEKFFVADAARGNSGNTGIGLSFTRQLVDLLNGRIEAVCENGWIRFAVTLPVNADMSEAAIPLPLQEAARPDLPSAIIRTIVTEQDDAARQPSVTEQNKKAITESLHSDKKTILIVEDEDAIRHLLRDVLAEKYIVFEAATGSDAIWFMLKKLPDLVISDVMMPDMDGLTLCKKIKNTPNTCHIPFILLSARTTPDQQQEGYEAGADAYIPKPFNTAYLLMRVRKLLEYRQQVQRFFSGDVQASGNAEAIPAGRDKDFIMKVVELIEANLNEPELNAAMLEQELKLSKMTLYRKIKSITDMTPGEFIRHHRIRKVASLLVQTDLPVLDIFYRTGFNNQSYFFREFKKQYQCSPNEYRAKHRLSESG